MNWRTSLPLLFALCAAFLAGVPSAAALDDEGAIDSAASALAKQRQPWYDPNTDDLKALRVEPPAAPPEPTYPDWEWNTPNTPSAPAMPHVWWGLFEWLFFLVLLLVFAGLIYVLIYYFVRSQNELGSGSSEDDAVAPAGEAERIENLPFPVRRPQGDLLDEARRQYEAGNYNEAIVYLYSYELVQLDRHQYIRLAQGKTNRQYLREVRPREEISSLLERTMVAFEDVFFGHHALSRERFESCWARIEQFHQMVAVSPA